MALSSAALRAEHLSRRRLAAVVASAVPIGVWLGQPAAVSVVVPALMVALAISSVVVLHRMTSTGSFVSPGAVLLGMYVTMAFVGALIPGRVARELPEAVRFRTATMYLLGILAFAGFGTITARAMRFRPEQEIQELRSRSVEQPAPVNAAGILLLLVAVLLGSLMVTWLLFYDRKLPLASALRSAVADPEGNQSRTILLDARLGFYRHGVQFLEQFRYGLAPFANVALFFLARRWRLRPYAVVALAAFPLTAVMLLGTGQRHPFASMLLFSAILLAYSTPRVFRRYVAPLGLGTAVIFWLQTFLLGRFDKTGNVVTDLWHSGALVVDRIVMTHAGIAFRTVELFRDDSVRLGRTWLNDLVNFIPFLPGKRESFTIELFRREYGGAIGSASPVAPLEGFVNFGYLGPAVMGAFLGLVLTALTIAVVRAGRRGTVSVLDLLFLAYVTANATRAGYGGLLAPLQVGLIPGFLLWLGLRAAARGIPQPTGMSR